MNFLGALAGGYTQDQVLNFIISSFPQLGRRIKEAKKLGHDSSEIIKLFQGSDQKELANLEKKLEVEKGYNPSISAQRETLRTSSLTQGMNIGKGLAKAGGSALGAYALSRALPKAVQQIAPQLAGQAISPTPIPQGPTPNISPAAANITEKQEGSIGQNVLNKSPIKTFIERALKMNQSSEDVAAAARKIHPKEVKALEKEAGENLEAILSKYQPETENAQETQLQGQERENMEPAGPKLVETPKEAERPNEGETPTVGNLALLPNGDIGEVQAIRKGIVKLDVDGKERHKKESELESVPISSPDLADLYSQLTQAIPESQRSSVINFAGYDPNVNELAFRPHGGGLYIYKDIPADFADKLKNAMFKAKTTGENFYGAWGAGEESRFAGLSQLIRDLQKQYGGKGKEYIRKYETLVDFLGAPEAAKKEKHKKLMEEKKLAKQKAKDEKKKRKKTL